MRLVSRIFTSWNRMAAWLRQIEGLRRGVNPRDGRRDFP